MNIAEIAPQWGSYVRDGDPGACMYGFSNNAVQCEEHRRQCVVWIDRHCRLAADRNETPKDDHRQLDELRAAILAAPLEVRS